MPNSRWHIRQRDEHEAIVSVLQAVQDFLASAEVKCLQQKTQDEYTYVLTTFAQWCTEHAVVQNKDHRTWGAVRADEQHPALALHSVDDQTVYCFLEHVAKTHTPAKHDVQELSSWTFANYVKNIKRFLNWCVLDEQYCQHVLAVTVKRIKKPKIEQAIIEAFSTEQVEALFKACDKEESEHLALRDKAIVALLLDTGIRENELVTLTIGHVSLDTKDPHVRVLGKGRKWGEVGFGEQTRRYLQKYLRQFREPTIEHRIAAQLKKLPARQQAQTKRQLMSQERFFVNRAGKPMTTSGLYQLIVRLGEWAEVEGVRCSPHTFRHTFAVMFMRGGGDIYQLSKLLRHTSVKVTEEYLKSLRQSEARKGARSIVDNL